MQATMISMFLTFSLPLICSPLSSPSHRYPSINPKTPPPPRPPGLLKVPFTDTRPGSKFDDVRSKLRSLDLKTVCEEASCPNVGECWQGGTGTIMLMGDTCTRGCMFCDVKTHPKPIDIDPFEPMRAAKAVLDWGVNYIVITSVDRDDVPDGGAAHFAQTVEILKENDPELLVECLVSDYGGSLSSVKTIVDSGLDVYAHNIETVRRLTPHVRDPRAGYDQSLEALREAKRLGKTEREGKLMTKSSIMLGLGEEMEEVLETMRDLRNVGVDILTLGQYLRPSEKHLGVVEWVEEDFFQELKRKGEDMGFEYVVSGRMVRSSYKAGEFYRQWKEKEVKKSRSVNY